MKPSKVEYESPSTATVCFTCAIRGLRANIKRQTITDNLFMTFLYSFTLQFKRDRKIS